MLPARSLLIASLLGLLACAAARAVEPGVSDSAQFFKAETIDKADAAIKRMKQRFGKDLMIETFRAIPDELQAAYRQKDRHEFYHDWLHNEARALRVNGIMVIVTREPGHLEVGAGNKTREKAFTD